MTARKRPRVTVDVKRWSAEVTGPVAHTVPAVRAALGQVWSMEYDNRRHCIRIPAAKAPDVIAALESAKVTVVLRGTVPQPELFDEPPRTA